MWWIKTSLITSLCCCFVLFTMRLSQVRGSGAGVVWSNWLLQFIISQTENSLRLLEIKLTDAARPSEQVISAHVLFLHVSDKPES